MKSTSRVVVTLVIIFAVRLFSQQQNKSEVRQQMVKICERDTKCLETVNLHFDTCYAQNVHRSGTKKDRTENLCACMNLAGGSHYFERDPSSDSK